MEARHAPLDLVDSAVRSFPLDDLDGRRIAVFCGIGNPKGFRRTLESLGGTLVGFRPFPDHHSYTAADVAELASWSAAAGADLVLTTQKDLVKLRAETLGPTPLRALRIGLEFLGGGAIIETALAPLLPTGR
jgi:tetraacyldisaccharide 4'-kinase